MQTMSATPLARVRGKPVTELPHDLYIPPDALEVVLETFEGPLDLLLYLIRRQNLDILDIPITDITRQYMEYIDMMQGVLRLELAAEYLLMAAILMDIKSRLLLPAPASDNDEEEDPRAELVRRLQLYEQFKQAAEDLDALPRVERDTAIANAHVTSRDPIQLPPDVPLEELLLALSDVLKRAQLYTHHAIERESLSVRERMTQLLQFLHDGEFHRFDTLLMGHYTRTSIVASFLAILELSKQQLVEIVQDRPLAALYIKIKRTAAI